jgi:hypothetical protein
VTAEGAGALGDDAAPPKPTEDMVLAGDPVLAEDIVPAAEKDTAEKDIDETGLDGSALRPDGAARDVVDLLEPADGLPPVITTAEDLAAAVGRLAAGTGPVAVDAERASGYRYGQRAYLVQLRRAGAGTVLIDPIACPDLSGLDAALAGVEALLPAVPHGNRLPAKGAVRHRAGRAAARLSPGGARHHAGGNPRLPAGEGALGRGLVGAADSSGDAEVRGA